MARNYSNTSDASGGFWETFDASERYSGYKKPPCEEELMSGKKKKNKKSRPAPGLVSLLYAKGNEASARPQNDDSGPSAWSMKSGSALFTEAPPEERRGRHEPYYPQPQDEDLGDEEEMMRRAIEESVRMEEERKRKEEKEEEEWMSMVCAELKASESRSGHKSTPSRPIMDSTDSDDFMPLSAKPAGKSATKRASQTSQKPERSQVERHQPERKPPVDRSNVERNVKKEKVPAFGKHSDKTDASDLSKSSSDWGDTEPLPQRSPKKQPPEKVTAREEKRDAQVNKMPASVAQASKFPLANTQKKFPPAAAQGNMLGARFSNLYDNYDDDGSESDGMEMPKRQTFWPSRNESHKWNQESWNGRETTGRGSGRETTGRDSGRGKPLNGKAQGRKPWGETPPEESEVPRVRHWKDKTSEQSAGEFAHKTSGGDKTRNTRGNHRTPSEDSKARGNHRTPSEDSKHVKFQTEDSSEECFASTNGNTNFDNSNFASTKSSFDESLYSNEAQRSRGPIASSRNTRHVRTESKPSVVRASDKKEVEVKDSRYMVSSVVNTHNTSRGNLGPNSWKHKVNNNPEVRLVTDMEALELESDSESEEEDHEVTNTREKSTNEKPASDAGKSNVIKPSNVSEPSKAVNSSSTADKNSTTTTSNLAKNSATTPNNVAKNNATLTTSNLAKDSPTSSNLAEISSNSLSNLAESSPLELSTLTTTSLREEMKAEVKLPQDNYIYNYYLNKQLGIHNNEDPLYPAPKGDLTPDPLSTPSPYPLSSPAPIISPSTALSYPLYPPGAGYTSRPPPQDPFYYLHPPAVPPPPSQVPSPRYTSTPLPPESGASWGSMPPPPLAWNSGPPPTTWSMPAPPASWSNVPVTPWSTAAPGWGAPHNTVPGADWSAPGTTPDWGAPHSGAPVGPPVPGGLPAHAPSWSASPTPGWGSGPPAWGAPAPPTAPVLADNDVWRKVLSQAANNPLMLQEMIQCLNRSTSTCTDPGQLDTLIAMSLEVDNAVRQMQKTQPPPLVPDSSDLPEAAEVPAPGGEALDPAEAALGRGRGKRAEPLRENVKSSPVLGRGRGYLPQ